MKRTSFPSFLCFLLYTKFSVSLSRLIFKVTTPFASKRKPLASTSVTAGARAFIKSLFRSLEEEKVEREFVKGSCWLVLLFLENAESLLSVRMNYCRDSAGMVMENKRSMCSLEENSMKRHKSDLSFSSKDKVGERVSALQQLVSPYGKTDTASVLLETVEYIQFLQEQVKVLTAPYLETTRTPTQEEYSLRGRGLCLVPREYTLGVGQTNGADIWAPVKTPKSNSPFR